MERRVGPWKDISIKSPEKARAHNSFGVAIYWNGSSDDAIKEYNRALMLDRDYLYARG